MLCHSLDSKNSSSSWITCLMHFAKHIYVCCFRERILGVEHSEVATSLLNLGQLLRQQEKFAEAENACRRCLELREKMVGSQHPEVAAALIGIFWSYSSILISSAVSISLPVISRNEISWWHQHVAKNDIFLWRGCSFRSSDLESRPSRWSKVLAREGPDAFCHETWGRTSTNKVSQCLAELLCWGQPLIIVVTLSYICVL